MKEINAKPSYIFEVSWEVCNKVGGIHTVISTKALSLKKAFGDKVIYIGPDFWNEDKPCQEFEEDLTLYKEWRLQMAATGLNIKLGRWLIHGNPIAILIDFKSLIPRKDEIFTRLWEVYKLESLNAEWEYVEAALFGYASGMVIENFINSHLSDSDIPLAHFHEWMAGTAIPDLRREQIPVKIVFTTHATMLGRYLAMNDPFYYDHLPFVNWQQEAKNFNIDSVVRLERTCAHGAHVFTTVSDITAKECTQFFKRDVDLVSPNGFENAIIPAAAEYEKKKKVARQKSLLTFLLIWKVTKTKQKQWHCGKSWPTDTVTKPGLEVTTLLMKPTGLFRKVTIRKCANYLVILPKQFEK